MLFVWSGTWTTIVTGREVIVITPLFVDMILIMMFDSFVVSLAGKMPVAASCVKIL